MFLDLYWQIHAQWELRLASDGSVDFDALTGTQDFDGINEIDEDEDIDNQEQED